MTKVMGVFQSANVKLRASKCDFCAVELHYLGHIISREGVRVDDAKIEVIKKWPKPQKVKDVRSFLGLASYYRRFIKKFAHIADPLTSLMRNDVKWQWGKEQNEAFEILKSRLISAPILQCPDFDKEFIVQMDASLTSLGAVLCQLDDEKKEHPIAYASRSMSKTERNYGMPEKECLAVMWATKKFRPYIYGRHFTLHTDNKALSQVVKLDAPEGKMARWQLKLRSMDFSVVHKKREFNTNADALTRLNVDETTGTVTCAPVLIDPDSRNQPRNVEIDLSVMRTMRDEQRKDPYLAAIKAYKESKILPEDDQLARDVRITATVVTEKDGVMMMVTRATKTSKRNPRSSMARVMVPKVLTKLVWLELHKHPTAGHLGFTKTYKKIHDRFVWDSMYSDVQSWCRSCNECQQRKGTLGHSLPQAIQAQGVWDHISIDFTKLPKTARGNKFVMNVVDVFSKWVIAFPTKKQNAEEVAENLHSIFLDKGLPRKITSDQGSEFDNKVVG